MLYAFFRRKLAGDSGDRISKGEALHCSFEIALFKSGELNLEMNNRQTDNAKAMDCI